MEKIKYSTSYRAWPVVGFLAITLFVFRKAIFSNLVAISDSGDAYYAFYSWGHYFIWAMKQGVFPLWNPLILCGHPFGTEAPSNFNILNLLNLFLHPNLAWNIRSMFCMFLAGYFMFLFARTLKISIYSSFICGLVFMFADSVVSGHLHVISFMIPIMLLILDKAVSRRSYRWVSLASILMTIFYLNSNPQHLIYVFPFCCAYLIFRYIGMSERYSIKDFLSIAGVFVLLTVGLSSLQILRTLEISGNSQRVVVEGWYYTLLPTHLITAIIPYFYESPYRLGEHNFFFGRISLAIAQKLPALFGQPFLTSAPYIGVMPFIMGLIAILKGKKDPGVRFLGWSVIIVAIYVSTSFLSHMVARYIPILKQMVYIQRSYVIYEFSMAVLVGFGIDILLYKGKSVWQPVVRYINKVNLLIITIIGVVMGIAYASLVWKKELFIRIGNEFVDKYVIGNPLYIAPAEVYRLRIEQLFEFLCSWTNIFSPSFYISAIIVISSALFIYLYALDLIGNNVFKIVVISVILCDLLIFKSSQIHFSTNEEVLPKVRAADFLTKQPGIFRVIPLQDIRDLSTPMKDKTFLHPATNHFYGLSTPEGFQSLILKRYVDLMYLFDKGTHNELTGKMAQFQDFNQHIANLINIKYVVTSKDRVLKSPFRLSYIDHEYRVYKNTEVFPRAFTVHKRLILNKEEDILNAIRDNDVPLDEVVILEVDSAENLNLPGSNETIHSHVSIEEYEPHSVVVNVDMKADGYLVLTDCYFPGWKVYVDGRQEKIHRADYIFRAVALKKGEHKLQFLYKPSSVKIGLILVVLSLSSIVCIFIKTRRKK
jgi:hypothetical protein